MSVIEMLIVISVYCIGYGCAVIVVACFIGLLIAGLDWFMDWEDGRG